MKTLLTAFTAVVVAFAAPAVASTPMPTLQLDISDPDNAYLQNVGAEPILLAGYEIDSAGYLFNTNAFTGFEARVRGDVPGEDVWWVLDMFGTEALGMGESPLHTHAISETAPGDPLSFPTWDPTTETGLRLNLGAFAANCDADDLLLRACIFDWPGTGRYITVEGAIVPEPASLSLLAFGGLAAMRRRRPSAGR